MPTDTPPKYPVSARQAYGFFYVQSHREDDALHAAQRAVCDYRQAFETHRGRKQTAKLLEASAFEDFATAWGYATTRDGEGRIIHLVREADTEIVPTLDHAILDAMARHVEGAELVFANAFGDGWEWRIEENALRYRSGRVTVVSKDPENRDRQVRE